MMEAENLSEDEQEALAAELSNEIFFFTGVCRLPKNDEKHRKSMQNLQASTAM